MDTLTNKCLRKGLNGLVVDSVQKTFVLRELSHFRDMHVSSREDFGRDAFFLHMYPSGCHFFRESWLFEMQRTSELFMKRLYAEQMCEMNHACRGRVLKLGDVSIPTNVGELCRKTGVGKFNIGSFTEVSTKRANVYHGGFIDGTIETDEMTYSKLEDPSGMHLSFDELENYLHFLFSFIYRLIAHIHKKDRCPFHKTCEKKQGCTACRFKYWTTLEILQEKSDSIHLSGNAHTYHYESWITL